MFMVKKKVFNSTEKENLLAQVGVLKKKNA